MEQKYSCPAKAEFKLENIIRAVERVTNERIRLVYDGRLNRAFGRVDARITVGILAREQGYSWEGIAKSLGYKEHSGLRKIVVDNARNWKPEKVFRLQRLLDATKKELMLTSPVHRIARLGTNPGL